MGEEMIGEVMQGAYGIIALAVALTASFFWMLGGRSNLELDRTPFGIIHNRVWGRWIAPLSLATGVIFLSKLVGSYSHWFWAAVPAYWASSTMGYGADNVWMKIFRRSLHSLVRTACLLPFVIVTGAWTIYITQAIVGLAVANLWGTRNPQIAAREELTINFCNCLLVGFTVL